MKFNKKVSINLKKKKEILFYNSFIFLIFECLFDEIGLLGNFSNNSASQSNGRGSYSQSNNGSSSNGNGITKIFVKNVCLHF